MAEHDELALELLGEIEDCEDDDRYRNLRDQLYGLGAAIVEILRAELESKQHRRRMAAATNLGRLRDAKSVPLLVGLLNDPQPGVREMALFALGILGDVAAVEPILAALGDYDADVRYRAVVALGDLGYAHLEDVLIRAMGDEAYGVREQALSQLRTVGTPRAMPSILRALLEREPDMQQMAEECLDRLIPKMTREHYKRLQEQLSPRERRLVLNYLEARNLQEVYGTLWQRLQVVSKTAPQQRGLDKYGRLLNLPEEQEFLSRAHGRDDVVEQLLSHFALPEGKRSILLVGEAGTGKTAIIQEFAQRLSAGDSTWQILETNTSELISGTRYLGDWETKLKEMTEAILKFDKVLLYLTNPNDLLGAGAHSKSDENFADFFKPYLHRGQLRMIAECTEEGLKNGLSRDPGFLRLFRQVKVAEMTDAESLSVLQARLEGIKVSKRKVTAEPGCLDQVVNFARSFYTRAAGPGRACDLMDALVDYAARTEEGDASKPLHLTSQMIPPCLSEATGISLDLLDDSVPLDLEATRTWFTERLIDQEHAIDAVVDRLALVKAGLGNMDKPLGVYFLVGPTGVGKTYFTKLVAERLFGNRDRMLRFDLSEYQGRFAVEKLIGSPHDKDREGLLTEAVRNQPYAVLLFDEFEKADHEIFSLFLQILDEGRLTDANGRTTDFRQTLVFLTSNLGASRASVSPLGFESDNDGGVFTGHINRKLDEFFAPEFLNRLDEVLVFAPLTAGAMHRLVDLEVKMAFDRRGFRRRGILVEADHAAREWLTRHGFSQRFGARELKRTIEKQVLTPISRLLVSEAGPHDGRRIAVTADDAGIAVAFATQPRTSVPREPKSPKRAD